VSALKRIEMIMALIDKANSEVPTIPKDRLEINDCEFLLRAFRVMREIAISASASCKLSATARREIQKEIDNLFEDAMNKEPGQ
jgi:hypothetical protein